MNSNLKGNIGETVALKHFISEGYEVYLPFGTASSVDMIIIKNGIVKRVSVKSTSRTITNGKFAVDIRQHRRGSILHFNKDSCDILFLYAVPEDRFKIIKSSEVKNKNNITI